MERIEEYDVQGVDEREKRHDFLKRWKDVKESSATYKKLISALLEIKCGADADFVCKLIHPATSTSTPNHLFFCY